ncbi:glycerophosphodiester phosphodiesterase [Leucobacter sp. OLJS4]|uniref:glycerophosphodiester phosphodiesterase family protein n=1 Tax=unclassified Leucobacter TaxID=2621730 RepID=UPI000C177009|nr:MULTISPECIES: glycerophosphodiester phosphodiesterase family protein [unclassified Leucobacter]PII81608.1 glycerophosphodiester phosphodiesterase [Leucobacter sp. OLCALW19]PII86279.1 glycerophosphodiester phosphodiesterase [Leucobacter sp. OLTLW20]PII90174.1 glycerophosphodiester phosphodiesterase [Leucobacter sp. OLAS13]PII97207.1 glycerophosphodiester phosphodiesterase [Leucobacter sp. OLDS2]PIJ01519.1 glycerophosphodiester phosphodiesterase [Leucobacter sp. OLCS4]
MTHPYFADAGRPRILAHRGFARGTEFGAAAENTAAAFAAADRVGADCFETDCRLTADGEVVLVHDPDLRRLATDPRRISEVRHAELAELFADRGGLLTLAEALERFPAGRFNVDVKDPAAAEQVGRIVAGQAHRILITGFSDPTRRAALASAVAHGGSAPATSPGRSVLVALLLALATGARTRVGRILAEVDALQIPERSGPVPVLTRRLLDAAHAHGTEVHVWTIDDPERMRALVARGVDGIVTDRSDLAAAAFGRER